MRHFGQWIVAEDWADIIALDDANGHAGEHADGTLRGELPGTATTNAKGKQAMDHREDTKADGPETSSV